MIGAASLSKRWPRSRRRRTRRNRHRGTGLIFRTCSKCSWKPGFTIADAEKRVLTAVLSSDGVPQAAARRHHRESARHWRFYADGPDRSVGYFDPRRQSESERENPSAAEVGELIELLLKEFRIPALTKSQQQSRYLEDLRLLLTTDYREVVSRSLKREVLGELSKVIENVIRPAVLFLRAGGVVRENHRLLDPLKAIFPEEELEIRAEPLTRGIGLSLRGFYCRPEIRSKGRTIIFLNTAHRPGAVAATFAHELAHYLYDRGSTVAAWEGAFHCHLGEPDELFADTLVSLSLYSLSVIRKIQLSHRPAVERIDFVRQVCVAYALMRFPYRIDLLDRKLKKSLRLHYLAELVHMLRLRGAVHSCLQI
jgi:hypothetical protein